MMKIFLTAFEPFGGNDRNISLDVLNAIPDSDNIRKAVLHVSFKQASLQLRQMINKEFPDFVIMLGQSGEGDNIRLERYAHNMMDSQKADNEGYTPDEEIIYKNAPEAYRTSLPIKSILSHCKEQFLPVVISNSAGLYVCNRVYFEALHLGTKSVFIHIPKKFELNKATTIIQFIISQL